MGTDYLLREQFVTDPTGVVAEYVGGSSLPEETAAISNHFIYSIMSNPRLLGWLRDQVSQNGIAVLGDEAFARDFGRALVDTGDHHAVLSLVASSREGRGIASINDLVLPIAVGLVNLGSLSSGTEMSTGTFATEQSGTHMSTGGAAIASGTEMSTGTFATEMSGTHMSTGGSVIASGTEMSTGTFATEQSGTHMSTGGSVIASGTEMSTGTFATEQSGTHMSTGGAVMAAGFAQVSIDALATFATQLRDAGALETVLDE